MICLGNNKHYLSGGGIVKYFTVKGRKFELLNQEEITKYRDVESGEVYETEYFTLTKKLNELKAEFEYEK